MSREALELFATRYLEEVSRLSLSDLADYQSPPYVSVTCGAAGIAYALWRVSSHLGDEHLRTARRWIDQARAGARRRDAFTGNGFTRKHVRGSLYNGPPALAWCDALVSHRLGDRVRARAAFGEFAQAARDARSGSPELLAGSAGFLAAASVLADALPGREPGKLEAELIGAVADRLADQLPSVGMAHGVAGMCFALLGACQRRGRKLPGALDRCLAGLAELGVREGRGTRWPVRSDGTGDHGGSFCNGSTGFALLWAKAYEVTGEAGYRTLARRSAHHAAESVMPVPDLCCGAIGASYAMLALARIDGGRTWPGRAMKLALVALTSPVQTEWTHGLFKGDAGMLCLAVDLLAGNTRVPGVEA